MNLQECGEGSGRGLLLGTVTVQICSKLKKVRSISDIPWLHSERNENHTKFGHYTYWPQLCHKLPSCPLFGSLKGLFYLFNMYGTSCRILKRWSMRGCLRTRFRAEYLDVKIDKVSGWWVSYAVRRSVIRGIKWVGWSHRGWRFRRDARCDIWLPGVHGWAAVQQSRVVTCLWLRHVCRWNSLSFKWIV